MNRKFEIYPFLDLEMDQPNGDIIQIGCTVGNIYTQEIIGTFNELVNPGHSINPKILKLTGLNEKDILNSNPLDVVVENFNIFMLKMIKKGSSNHCIAWGGNDSKYLIDRALLVKKSVEITPNSEDMKPVLKLIRRINNQHTQGGMSTYMKRFGLNFIGKKHNGFDDSYNSFRLYCLIMKIFKDIQVN